ncbi:NAD(P)H-hydrate dehydratase [Actomonas aquatica]|uniref:ADP-dependent (S)-NAD(P)H-hydrate dehydratase n=1 Tax=Actomonas aquatica TaxID=2866162 RepID=A0ABZ1CGD8_9BACT|nr:NAD(P)H-hydrate dehydratase [Opitutus sp. WL0086]WRQ89634.1 NAD(P)H-hydrate dehydratase [Opitutus sp. WL0086]
MTYLPGTHPILDCAAAAAWERELFGGDEAKEWAALQQAGRAVAHALLEDLAVAGASTHGGRLLLLVGKGHNGGDALLAAAELLGQPGNTWQVEVGFVFGQNALRPLAVAAWRRLQEIGGSERVRAVTRDGLAGAYAAVLDGVFGFQFRPPLREPALAWLAASAALTTRVRAAVDLPSGLDEDGAFRADVTYATGILKTPLLNCANAGRLRYLDLGFFTDASPGEQRVLTTAVLNPLRQLRPAHSDKRTFGHVVIVGGSRSYPGAVAMSAIAALHSGAGLVTACVPESIAAAMAAQWPEIMWMGCAETPDGGIAIESGLAIREKLSRAQALVIGPGLSREPETHALVAELIRQATTPMVLDADALQSNLIALGTAPRVLTPHAGEYARIEKAIDPSKTHVVRKAPITTIKHAGVIYHGIDGGPVLARGGSGDILAGLIGGLLAGEPTEPIRAAAQAVTWQGLAARAVARSQGEVVVRTTAIIDHLNAVLRTDPAA